MNPVENIDHVGMNFSARGGRGPMMADEISPMRTGIMEPGSRHEHPGHHGDIEWRASGHSWGRGRPTPGGAIIRRRAGGTRLPLSGIHPTLCTELRHGSSDDVGPALPEPSREDVIAPSSTRLRWEAAPVLRGRCPPAIRLGSTRPPERGHPPDEGSPSREPPRHSSWMDVRDDGDGGHRGIETLGGETSSLMGRSRRAGGETACRGLSPRRRPEQLFIGYG